MIESPLTSKAQTTVPKAVRAALGVGPGDRSRYVISGDDVRILAVRSVEELFGSIDYDGPTVALGEVDHAVADGASGR